MSRCLGITNGQISLVAKNTEPTSYLLNVPFIFHVEARDEKHGRGEF